MNFDEYINKMQNVQNILLQFIEGEDDKDDKFQELIQLLDDSKIRENSYEFRSFLHLLIKVSKNHHRHSEFFNDFERIINFLKDDIQKQFSNNEIFTIFKGNLKILLFLIQSQIVTPNRYISLNTNANYFYPEVKDFIQQIPEKFEGKKIIDEIPEKFEENRQKGENESHICELIRNNSITEFVTYTNQINFNLSLPIEKSLFETNSFLKDKEVSLIEYAAFYGSINIFQYLKMKGAKLTPSLWLYAIHSNNPEMIHLLESLEIEPEDKSYQECFIESIKCHHNRIATYIQNSHLQNEKENSKEVAIQCLKYYNFQFLQNDQIDKSLLFKLIQYDYCQIVEVLLREKDIDVNEFFVTKEEI